MSNSCVVARAVLEQWWDRESQCVDLLSQIIFKKAVLVISDDARYVLFLHFYEQIISNPQGLKRCRETHHSDFCESCLQKCLIYRWGNWEPGRSRTFLNNCFPVLWLWNESFAFLTLVITQVSQTTTKIQMHVCSCYNSISVRPPLAFKSYNMSFHCLESSAVIPVLFKEVKDDHIISFPFIFVVRDLVLFLLSDIIHLPSWSLECFERWI